MKTKLLPLKVSVLLLFSILYFWACQDDLNNNIEKNVVYSSSKKGFHVYKNIPLKIQNQLSSSNLEFVTRLAQKRGIVFLDKNECDTSKFKKIDNFNSNQLKKLENIQFVESKTLENSNNKLLKLNNEVEVKKGKSVESISLLIAQYTNSWWDSEYAPATLLVHLNWQYIFNNDTHLAEKVTNKQVEMIEEPFNLLSGGYLFDGMCTVDTIYNGIEFIYGVNGVIRLGVCIEGNYIAFHVADINKSGNYLCPWE
ncbi:hypothetical protein EMN47_11045 [Prolixibacteraceae bacterium JC049]|nr:hypothetical protein [Prolixibacteraceae bacterium JC049]